MFTLKNFCKMLGLIGIIVLSGCQIIQGILDSDANDLSQTLSSHQQNTKSPNTSLEQLKSQEEIGKAARLTPDQIKKLLPVDSNISSNQKRTLIPIVPTYIPSGFEIVDFGIIEMGQEFDYRIEYYNSLSNECFRIGATIQVGGDPAEYHEKTNKVNSLIGSITLGYTKFSEMHNTPLLSSLFSPIEDRKSIEDKKYYPYYFFTSPSSNKCKIITFKEAQKIVQSLQYLTHYTFEFPEIGNSVREGSIEDRLY